MPRKEEHTVKSKWWKKHRRIVGLVEWSKRHSRIVSLIEWVLLLVLSIGLSLDFYLFSIPFALITTRTDVLKILIEAEATILGFFGLIAVYALTSYDNRIDRVEERILNKEEADDQLLSLFSLTRKIRERKTKFVLGALPSLASLVLSFFLSITVLGLVNINPNMLIAYQLSIAASSLLFTGVFAIFMMLYRMGKEPEETLN